MYIVLKFIFLTWIHLVASSYIEYRDESLNTVLYTNGSDVKVKTYNEAVQYCQRTGGKVVEIPNEKHQRLVERFVHYKLSGLYLRKFFLGLQRHDYNPNEFVPIHGNTGSKTIVITTSSNEKNFIAIRNGVAISKDSNSGGAALCVYDREHCLKNSTQYLIFRDRCYKTFFEISWSNWYYAKKTCIKDGGNLAYFDEYRDHMGLPLKPDTYWIGYSRISWHWKSNPTNFASYTNWEEYDSESTRHNDDLKCAVIDQSHEWRPSKCNPTREEHIVVCMKDIAPIRPSEIEKDVPDSSILSKLNRIEEKIDFLIKKFGSQSSANSSACLH